MPRQGIRSSGPARQRFMDRGLRPAPKPAARIDGSGAPAPSTARSPRAARQVRDLVEGAAV